MYFISEHSSCNEEGDNYGTLIGIHGNFLYSANSFDEELKIYRRKVIETREWELFWSCEISSRSSCSCSNTVSAAYGIIGDEIFVAAYGLIPNDDEIRFHLSSVNLITSATINYKTSNINNAHFSVTLCNQCCQSSISALNPENPFEISILPWSPESFTRFSTIVGTFTDYIQTKFAVNPETKICTYLQAVGFKICGQSLANWSQSNIGILEFGKVLFFRNNELILGGTNASETKLEIVKESDFQKCVCAGFYSTPNGLQCIGFEKSDTVNQQICSIFNVFIDEERHVAKFTKVSTLPSILLPSDPTISKFILDSRMLIWSCQNQTFTYIFGMLSLSEASYISSSNAYSPLHKEYQKLAAKTEYKYGDGFGIHKEEESLGLTQNGIKELLGLSKSFEFFIN